MGRHMINIKEFFNLTYYTSKLDQFLAAFKQKNPKLSTSQRMEKEKYAKIFQMRDDVSSPASKDTLWDKF